MNSTTALFIILLLASPVWGQSDESNDLRVMSFNLRYGTANDGDNRWDARKQLVAQTIRKFAPDLLGTQETLPIQSQFLSEQFSEFTAFGRSRHKTHDDGEQCTIFYRTDRFTKLGAGHLWLSGNPNQPGSKDWDSSLPRMATWLCLRDQRNPDSPVCIFNTHFDHRGKKARNQSAKLIANRAAEFAKSHWNAKLIVTGDFNTGEDSKPYRFFINKQARYVDTYRAAHPKRESKEGTFNAFKGIVDRERIDWILVDPKWTIRSADIVRDNADGHYPSDHFPVTAVLGSE